MHGTKVWQRRTVKVNPLQGEKTKGLQQSIAIIHPKSHYRIGSHCYLKLFKKRKERTFPHPIMLMFYIHESFGKIIDTLLKIKERTPLTYSHLQWQEMTFSYKNKVGRSQNCSLNTNHHERITTLTCMPEETRIEVKNEGLSITHILWSVTFSSSVKSTHIATVSQISNHCMTFLGYFGVCLFVFSAARFSY